MKFWTILSIFATTLIVTAPVNAQLYSEDFTGDDGASILTLGWVANSGNPDADMFVTSTDENMGPSEAIDNATITGSQSGWTRFYYPFTSAVTSGPIFLEADVNLESGNQQFGFAGGSPNPENRGAYVRATGGTGMLLANMTEGNQDSGLGGYARIRIDVDLNTNASTLTVTGLEGQGNATVSGTWDGGAGAGVTGLYLSTDIRNLAATGIAVDNIVVGVPEPASGMLAAAGLLGLALCWSRRRRR